MSLAVVCRRWLSKKCPPGAPSVVKRRVGPRIRFSSCSRLEFCENDFETSRLSEYPELSDGKSALFDAPGAE